jgi:hypothetical protein
MRLRGAATPLLGALLTLLQSTAKRTSVFVANRADSSSRLVDGAGDRMALNDHDVT